MRPDRRKRKSNGPTTRTGTLSTVAARYVWVRRIIPKVKGRSGLSVNSNPAVSVVIPVWNVEPYLRECLDSVVSQSIGPDRLEVLAVDDGSTDGSGPLLDEYAERYPQVRVFHESNSAGPGRPRNVGLDNAVGTYVFFLDADDYLGREALERLVGMAEKNGSDVVLGKMVGVGGRRVPGRAFRHTLDRAKLHQVYSTLSVLKMFRRSLIEQVGARFPEGLASNEDGIFTQRMYLVAKVISVVADYDCYYYRLRPGSQTRGGAGHTDLLRYLAIMSERMELLAESRPPGDDRERLMTTHIRAVLDGVGGRWRAHPAEDRQRIFQEAAALIKRWHTGQIQASLSPPHTLAAYCLEHGLSSELEDIVACRPRTAFGNPIFEGQRVFARYPHFRDGSGIPDDCFELTGRLRLRLRIHRLEVAGQSLAVSGEASLRYIGGSTTIILRRQRWGPELRFIPEVVPTPLLRDGIVSYPEAGFSMVIDLDTADNGRRLPNGAWDIDICVGRDGVSRTAPVEPAEGNSWAKPRVGARVTLRISRNRNVQLSIGQSATRRIPGLVAQAVRRRMRGEARTRGAAPGA
jgi:hypothetical protein